MARTAQERQIQQAFAQYGMWLFIFYCGLAMADIAIKHLRSLDEKYDIVRRFGLQKIW